MPEGAMTERSRPSSASIEITPQGIRRERRDAAALAAENFELLRQVSLIVATDLKVENFGTVFGQAWLIIDPLLQALLYFFLIKVILGVSGKDVDLVFIFAAVTFWRSHQVLLAGAPGMIRARGAFFLQTG